MSAESDCQQTWWPDAWRFLFGKQSEKEKMFTNLKYRIRGASYPREITEAIYKSTPQKKMMQFCSGKNEPI